jgi:hypothetical protein
VRRRLPLILAAVAVFLGVSVLVARYLSTETDERNAVIALVRAEARGDAGAMLDRLDGCRADPACRAQTQRNAARLRRPGEVKVFAYQSGTAYALGTASGLTRIAWGVIDRGLPVVQCVRVRREGNALTGRRVTLQRLSAPIGRESPC